MNYGISSRDYLYRAKKCLDNNNMKYLFYAAFEIRCGVEARMKEYLEFQEHISKKKRQGWEVAKLSRNIEQVFRVGEKEAVLRVLDKNTKELLLEARYTPVKKSLQKKAQKLGDFLHAAKKYQPDNSLYWKKFKSLLEEAISELEYATSGNLLGPLLIHPEKKIVDMKLELLNLEEQGTIKRIASLAETMIAVSYV